MDVYVNGSILAEEKKEPKRVLGGLFWKGEIGGDTYTDYR